MKNMSQDYTARHKSKHPESESRRKEKQRQKESFIRLHFKRNFLYGYGLPDTIDQESDIFRRVRAEYLSEVEQQVEVMEA